jgi:hypothetical protein
MNETPSSHTAVATEQPVCKAPLKDNTTNISQFTTPTSKECRDDESFNFSPIQMNVETPRDATINMTDELDTSFPQNNDDIEITSDETESQRLARELSESESLARQLMAEEAMASYQMSSNFLRENADQFSEEDLAALQAAMAEEDPEEEEEEEGEMSYDTLLRLGERIGNVKEERWAVVAREMIDSIPLVKFTLDMAEGKEENHTHVKCQICQFAYEEGDMLRMLKCGHCFHGDCVGTWLMGKDTCAFCRKSIVD